MLGAVDNMITQTAPFWVPYYWGGSLFFGALAALLGSFWIEKKAADGLVIEAFGLVVITPAAVVYAATVFLISGLDGILGGCSILGFGIFCLIRIRDIFRVLRSAGKLVKEANE
jgi:hypothetical protein